MEEEKVKEKELERLVNEEVEKMWQKRLHQWQLERQARKKLLQDVMAGRAVQIRERCKWLVKLTWCLMILQYTLNDCTLYINKKEREREILFTPYSVSHKSPNLPVNFLQLYLYLPVAENDRKQRVAEEERMELLRTIEENRRLEEQQAAKLWEKNHNYQRDLQDQIIYNSKIRELEQHRDEEEFLLGMQAEREYQVRLKECLDNPQYDKLHPMRRAMQNSAH